MKFQCPYCLKFNHATTLNKDQQMHDGEMVPAQCKHCKNEYFVCILISKLTGIR